MSSINISTISQRVVETIPQHMGHTEVIEEIGVDESGHQWRRYHTQFILNDQYKGLAPAHYERIDTPVDEDESAEDRE